MGSGWRGILGFDYGIVQAPLGPDISGPEPAAAVANAGAIGLIRLPDFLSTVSTSCSLKFFPLCFSRLSTGYVTDGSRRRST
jgi:hypothetical protein